MAADKNSGKWIAIGVAIGAGMGVAMGNIGVWHRHRRGDRRAMMAANQKRRRGSR